jgi:hypothetical protein
MLRNIILWFGSKSWCCNAPVEKSPLTGERYCINCGKKQ